ncbi:S8 family peptidase [Methanolobus chelungpuianus]|uniref:Subtilisin n=1 Tax=Methanolobus chelungpuianus TaxID=502115 RepID=A0AAE3HCN1_9EURY|nr:S8 family serine peptidase [Methanolobus chelungpuianus]MCQ6963594.1 subtilisin [Methanolobus chelungpuianus]
MALKKITLLVIACILLSFLAVPAVAVQEEKDNEKIPVLISFKGKANAELVKAYGGNVKHEYTIVPAVAAELPQKAIDALSKNPNIDFIEPDGQAQILADEVPWGITRINAVNAQSSGFTGTGIKVAVLDTGIDYTHPDLMANYLGGYDFVNRDNDPMDDHSHGTHVAGTVAAASNGIGVLGAAPQAGLYSVKVADSSGYCSYSNIIAGINWAVDNNADVITMSLGGTSSSSTLQSACDNAYSKGVVLVGAAGNSGGSVIYPAAYSSVIAVSAVDSTNAKTSWSCYGPQIEFAAPGVSIKSTMPGGLYGFKSGTSMATPHVTGAVALLMSTDAAGTSYDANKNGNWDPAEVRSRLQKTATDLGATGKDDYYGYGLVNAYAAVNGLENAPAGESTPVPDTSLDTEPVIVPDATTENKIFVGSLTAVKDSSLKGKNTFGWAVFTVKVVDSSGKAIPGASVNGSWSGLTSGTVSGVTDAGGVVKFTSSQVKSPAGTFTFTVNEVACSGYVYDPSQNVLSTLSVTF